MRSLPCQLVLLAVILLLISACHKETEEDKVRKVITNVQKSAEERKIMSVPEQVSKTYQDPQGNNYDGIKGLLAFYFFRHQKLSVFIPNIDIVATGPAASATLQAILTGRSGQGKDLLLRSREALRGISRGKLRIDLVQYAPLMRRRRNDGTV